MRKIIYLIGASQILTFLFSIVFQREISLLHYINYSFYIASSLLFVSLIVYTVNTGFFDNVSKSFRQIFASREKLDTGPKEEMMPLSEIISFNYFPLAWAGLGNMLLMLVALAAYYM
ncbi:DUF3899 domain-containing protein [Mesobacillus zeae]|uniref:DUF3899 domain-containing protein n=1 Tax=Mesobacillus zeae TaxID=1917180 RepID=A0A398B292_9BACI|nr:DUF3899 domain-containing protein [Mesobacillus zeae]RID82060.1 DUF3899 domain-containing protein [Mesobacillus zeae]